MISVSFIIVGNGIVVEIFKKMKCNFGFVVFYFVTYFLVCNNCSFCPYFQATRKL